MSASPDLKFADIRADDLRFVEIRADDRRFVEVLLPGLLKAPCGKLKATAVIALQLLLATEARDGCDQCPGGEGGGEAGVESRVELGSGSDV